MYVRIYIYMAEATAMDDTLSREIISSIYNRLKSLLEKKKE